MFSSLLVLLAPMGFENCTLKRNKPLFSDPRLSINPTVRIVEGDWDEARLVPHVAGILIQEMFGLTVEYVRDGVNGTGSNSSRMYDMLKKDEADLALTLWPAKFLTTDRLEALSASSCEKSLSERCVATVGNQGYKGRSGWFVTADVDAVRGKEAEWSTVVSLYDQKHTENLTKAYQLPIKNLCDSVPDALSYGGKFDCADGSWMHDDSACCSRSDYNKNLCGAKKPCVALMVDKPSYDAGLNELIAGRLAQEIRVSNQDDQAVGIQIVYGDVTEAVKDAEANNRPLLIYSWLPRPKLMMPNRFVRITLESFYHCGKGDAAKDASNLAEPSFLAKPLLRGVAACDFPVEQVEKAAVWRLQQPSATNAKLFVGKFSLSSTQLEELLELESLSLLQSSDSSPASPDEIACRWLNRNTKAWEDWLPSSHLYDTTLFQWEGWVVGCSLCFFGVLCCVIWEAKKMRKKNDLKREEKEKGGRKEEEKGERKDETGEHDSQWGRHRQRLQNGSTKQKASAMYDPNEPLKEYLYDAGWCLINFGLCEWKVGVKLFLFVLGKVFVAASSGFFKILLFESWLGDGLNKLSLEVTISCAALMLTLHLIEWFINWSTSNGLLPSGEEIVHDQLASKLREQVEAAKALDGATKQELLTQLSSMQSLLDPTEEQIAEVRDRLELKRHSKTTTEDQAETNAANAKELASDCYMSAVDALFSLLGVVFATGFLFYYFFKDGVPQDPSALTIAAFFFGPMWLILGLFRLRHKTKHLPRVPTRRSCDEQPQTIDEKAVPYMLADVLTYEQAYSGIQWISMYTLWALAPIFMTPLMNDYSNGKSSALQSDVLTVLLVLQTMGESLIDAEKHFIKMLCSSDKAKQVNSEVSELLKDLNGESTEGKAKTKAALKVAAVFRRPSVAQQSKVKATKADQTKTDADPEAEAKPDQTKTDAEPEAEAKPDQTKTDAEPEAEAKPDQTKADAEPEAEAKADQTKAAAEPGAQAKADQTKAAAEPEAEAKADQTKAAAEPEAEAKPDQTKADAEPGAQAKPDQTKAAAEPGAQAKPDQTKVSASAVQVAPPEPQPNLLQLFTSFTKNAWMWVFGSSPKTDPSQTPNSSQIDDAV